MQGVTPEEVDEAVSFLFVSDFSALDTPEETEPKEAEPQETKPEEPEPDERKPAETEPDETKPGETEPDETTSGETTPSETESSDTNPETSDPEPPRLPGNHISIPPIFANPENRRCFYNKALAYK